MYFMASSVLNEWPSFLEYLSTDTASPPRGDYVQVSGVLQNVRQRSES